ncbi:hypothetical protein TNIN_135071 [Trichonephila inaurata madagascariensis]|uniref:Uncharacterized protein n=1 Tax=Trichonephila inaurata madagascariensis TaxID=2747483 RepID=A0A8X6Y0P5_9ARAC|nr:hypothetical protein TNIN_135071 [Trichonephila inaurata madagascariensis]
MYVLSRKQQNIMNEIENVKQEWTMDNKVILWSKLNEMKAKNDLIQREKDILKEKNDVLKTKENELNSKLQVKASSQLDIALRCTCHHNHRPLAASSSLVSTVRTNAWNTTNSNHSIPPFSVGMVERLHCTLKQATCVDTKWTVTNSGAKLGLGERVKSKRQRIPAKWLENPCKLPGRISLNLVPTLNYPPGVSKV